jgi:hypothetical protein
MEGEIASALLFRRVIRRRQKSRRYKRRYWVHPAISCRLLEGNWCDSLGGLASTYTTQKKGRYTYMPRVEFETTIPVLEQINTVHALQSATTVIGSLLSTATLVGFLLDKYTLY